MTIHALDITDPTDTPAEWWHKAEGLKGLTRLEFKPGLNILFGPNGFGKSTILKTLAALTHCLEAGMPAFTLTSLQGWCDTHANPRQQGVKLTHDGALCFYADPTEKPGLDAHGRLDSRFIVDGCLSAVLKGSSGEQCMVAINRVVGLAHAATECQNRSGLPLDELRNSSGYRRWKATQIEVKAEGRAQRTLLLDEFDRSLDIPSSHHVWSVLAFQAQQKHQIITATHDPLALQLADAGLCNLIDLCPGYVDACRAAGRALGERLAAHKAGRALGPAPQPFAWRKLAVPNFEKPVRRGA